MDKGVYELTVGADLCELAAPGDELDELRLELH
jgi:hypothetical protein